MLIKMCALGATYMACVQLYEDDFCSSPFFKNFLLSFHHFCHFSLTKP